jgi:hypothetical protein
MVGRPPQIKRIKGGASMDQATATTVDNIAYQNWLA